MSPEQAGRSDLDVDTRSDIYALGVLLYELLAGRLPFDPNQLAEAGLEAMVRCIREEEPLRPSTRLSKLQQEDLTTTAQRRGTAPLKLINLLRGDLDWIVMKCLEKDRTRRYETANALARDLESYRKQEPVTARLWNAADGQPVAEPLRHSRPVDAAHFSPDGRWIVTASQDRTAAIWRILRPTPPPPAWLAELAEAVAGKRLTATGLTEATSPSELLRLKQSRALANEPDEYERWAAWFFADRGRRRVAPEAALTVSELIQQRVRWACHKLAGQPQRLEEALRYEPTNALCLASLVQVQARWNFTNSPSTLANLDWLARRALGLAPAEPVVQWARALTLARQGDLTAASQLLEQVRQAGFKDTCFVVDYTDLLVKTRRLSEAYRVFPEALKWPYPESPVDRHCRTAYRNDWTSMLARTQSSKALRVFDLVISDIPARRPDAPAQMLDLAFVNSDKLSQLWIDAGADLGGLSDFLEGRLTLGGVTFDARGFVKPIRQGRESMVVTAFPVRRSCRCLHFLQTVLLPLAPDTRAGSYRVGFGDGERLDIPIVYGRNVCAFVTPANEPEQAAPVAWEHRAPDSTRLRLCLLTWDNPRPDIAIDRIEFLAERRPCEPILLAITAEP